MCQSDFEYIMGLLFCCLVVTNDDENENDHRNAERSHLLRVDKAD